MMQAATTNTHKRVSQILEADRLITAEIAAGRGWEDIVVKLRHLKLTPHGGYDAVRARVIRRAGR